MCLTQLLGVGDVDRGEQNKWKKPAGRDVYGDHLSSWVLALNNPKDMAAFCQRAQSLKETT